MDEFLTPMETSTANQLVQLRYSPLIPRTIDNTAMKAWECPRKFAYSMLVHRRRGGLTRPPLAYGTTWHKIKEAHYRSGGNRDVVMRECYMSWEQHDNPEDHRTPDRAMSAYDAWIREYGNYEDESRVWGRTVGFPDNPVVEQPVELWWPGARHPYTGKIDRIYELNGQFYVEDHKTSAQLGDKYFNQWDPSNQMMGYAVLAHELTGLPIAGVRICAHGVLKTQNKFKRKTLLYNPARLVEWKANYNAWIERIEHAMEILGERIDLSAPLDLDTLMADEEILLRAFPHNFEACAGKYGQCVYEDVCTSTHDVRARILKTDFVYEPWDPMAVDDEEAE